MNTQSILILVALFVLSLQINIWPQPKQIIVGNNAVPLAIHPCNIGLSQERLFEYAQYPHFIKMMEKYAKMVFRNQYCVTSSKYPQEI